MALLLSIGMKSWLILIPLEPKKTTHLHYATQSATYDISNAKKVELNDKHLYHFKKIILSFYHVIFHGFRVLKINAISLSLKKYFMAKK